MVFFFQFCKQLSALTQSMCTYMLQVYDTSSSSIVASAIVTY